MLLDDQLEAGNLSVREEERTAFREGQPAPQHRAVPSKAPGLCRRLSVTGPRCR